MKGLEELKKELKKKHVGRWLTCDVDPVVLRLAATTFPCEGEQE